MKTPTGLQPLIDDGVIDAVMRPLKSGKEAAVYVVRAGDDVRCAKVYKDMAQRSFQQRVQYQEGRKVRGSREARAIGKASKYGRKQQETAWKNTEVEALYRLRDAGVRVPEPYGYFHGVLVMELVVDADGHSAPRLGEVELAPDQARGFHRFLVRQVVKMLCEGLIHGDLSAYNVLVAPDGPVLIDFPQVVSAAGNNAARTMLLRDVNNLTATLGAFAPELLDTWYGEEMWALY
ncbi:MAG TPA: PA4780 family RIO1-like protein kinase, partial [Thermomonas sp.]|nr:PA4780 family RIO1-like protein kinase [Thermomonas sp.]